MKSWKTKSILLGGIGVLFTCLLAGPGNYSLAAAESAAGFGGDGKPTPFHPELAQLRAERARLLERVSHYEEQVIYWQNEVRGRPESLVAPIGLRDAIDTLRHYQTQLEIVELRIRRLENAML
jgi:hypothetical protein